MSFFIKLKDTNIGESIDLDVKRILYINNSVDNFKIAYKFGNGRLLFKPASEMSKNETIELINDVMKQVSVIESVSDNKIKIR